MKNNIKKTLQDSKKLWNATAHNNNTALPFIDSLFIFQLEGEKSSSLRRWFSVWFEPILICENSFLGLALSCLVFLRVRYYNKNDGQAIKPPNAWRYLHCLLECNWAVFVTSLVESIDVLIFCYFDFISIDADDIFKASGKGDIARVRVLVASGKSTNLRDTVRRRG
jgi:hypothetical protein